MNGNPLPPIQDMPPADGFFLVLLVLIVGIFLVGFVMMSSRIEQDAELQRREIFSRAIEQKKEEIVQSLIDQSPGGRKPWQDRSGE